MTTFSHGRQARLSDDGVIFRTPFNYLIPELQFDPTALLHQDPLQQTYDALDALGNAMVDQGESEHNSPIPPIFTYWGQFIDHDVTLFTDRDTDGVTNISENIAPRSRGTILSGLVNGRQPALNLDSLYGSGPFEPEDGSPPVSRHLYESRTPEKFRIGTVADTGLGEVPPPAGDLRRDLPRNNRKAVIADARNDENLIIAQFHLALLRFHNAVVDSLGVGGEAGYRQARELVVRHYQWLVLHQWLKTIARPDVVDFWIDGLPEGRLIDAEGQPFMPLEFAGAAFRFGHSMVRGSYDFNRNFGQEANILPEAPFTLIFQFTGNGEDPFLGQADVLPANWIIEWDRFVNTAAGGMRSARLIDSRLAIPLSQMVNAGSGDLPEETRALLKHLARRNLRRAFQLRIPCAQAMADMLGVTSLAKKDLKGETDEMNDALVAGRFLERTPLWYYVLKEAEVQESGKRLGELGSHIIAITLIGLLKSDPDSILRQPWSPVDSPLRVDGAPIDSIEKVLRFAGV